MKTLHQFRLVLACAVVGETRRDAENALLGAFGRQEGLVPEFDSMLCDYVATDPRDTEGRIAKLHQSYEPEARGKTARIVDISGEAH